MSKVTIIAELGINHNGDLELAKKMALAAKAAGCDMVKIQKRSIEHCYTPQELVFPCESPWGATVRAKVEGRELDWDQVRVFDEFCKSIDLPWFASCFDLQSFRDYDNNFYAPVNKIASAMALHQKFLEEVAREQTLTLISTGLLDLQGIRDVARTFEVHDCPYVMNHCVALYPAPPDRLNLMQIRAIQREMEVPVHPHFRGVGYSGHEVSVLPSVIAASLGATFIERHFTLDRSLYGADQAASLEPEGMRRLVRDIRSLEQIMGSQLPRELQGDEKNPVMHFDADA